MKHKELFKLLDEVQEQGEETTPNRHDKVLILDGLNLFFRNFAMMNMVNPDGVHIGGLGGFFRSLGAMIRQTNPTSVYVVFDGAGSTVNRKNLLSEYKGTRNLQRITNWEAFDNIEEEHDSKIDQIVRIIQYLKLLPVKTTILDKVEADDIIAVLPSNFILHKTLLGDNSDNVKGVKGLGAKGIFKKFPELKTTPLTLDDIFDICARKYKEHIVYSRIIQDRARIEINYKVMDLSVPMIDDRGKEHINGLIGEELPEFNADMFISFYNEDKLGGMIRNLDTWLKDIFSQFPIYKQ